MHAAIVKLTIDPAQASAAAAAFTAEILPAVRSAPGLVAAYFVDPVDGRGLGFLVFDSEAHAMQSTPPAAKWSAPGVTIEGTEYRRVAVDISSAG